MLFRSGDTTWGLLALGDTPGIVALAVEALPGRVAHTTPLGALRHSTERGGVASSAALRVMADLWLAGLTHGFVSLLFSSFVRAALRRSLRSPLRSHFGAMYSMDPRHGTNRHAGLQSAMVFQALSQPPRASEGQDRRRRRARRPKHGFG